nr:unnamed protein product [Callosobruchus analis]
MSRNRFQEIKKYLHLADNTKIGNKKTSALPLGSKVVLQMLDVVAVPSDHEIFFDNYFASYSLMQTLKEKGFRVTGTVRENRIKKCPLLPSNPIKKKDPGYFEYCFNRTSLLLFVKWKDNNVVTMASNYDAIEPLSKVKRWCGAAKGKIHVPQPKLFSTYNVSMGGVDLFDQSVNKYRVCIQEKNGGGLFSLIC